MQTLRFEQKYFCFILCMFIKDVNLNRHFVFLPGTLLNADQFAPQLRKLSSTHTVSAFEYVRNSCNLTRKNLIETWAQDSLDYVKSIGRPVTLCGHSFGGIIAQIVAFQRPELIERLVLVETNFCSTDGLLDTVTLPLAKLFLRSTPWPQLRKHILNVHGQHSFEAKMYLEATLSPTHEPAFARDIMRAALDWGGKEKLNRIFPPTDIIVGEFYDRTAKQAEHFQTLIPNAQLHKIGKAGHLVNLDAPAAFNSILLQQDASVLAA